MAPFSSFAPSTKSFMAFPRLSSESNDNGWPFWKINETTCENNSKVIFWYLQFLVFVRRPLWGSPPPNRAIKIWAVYEKLDLSSFIDICAERLKPGGLSHWHVIRACLLGCYFMNFLIVGFSSQRKVPYLHKLGVLSANYGNKHPIWAKLDVFCMKLEYWRVVNWDK